MICISLRRGRSSARESPVSSRPSKVTLPAVASASRRMTRPAVVLPEPDSPTSPSVSPRRISKSIAVDRLDVGDVALQDAGGDREVLAQVAHDDQVVGSARRDGAVGREGCGHLATCGVLPTALPGTRGTFSASIGF